MPFPFLFLTLSLVIGILVSSYSSISLSSLTLAIGTSLTFSWIFFLLFKRLVLSFLLILLTTFFLGAMIYSLSHKNFENNSLHQWKASSYADFYGTLYKSPSRGRDRNYLFLKVMKVSYQNKEEKLNGNLRISVRHSSQVSLPADLLVQDEIRVSAQLINFQGYRNFSSPAFQGYFKNQNIHARAFSKSPLLVERIGTGNKFSLLRMISWIRQKIQQKIEEHFSSSESGSLSQEGAVLEALLLGERGRIDEDISRSLQQAGLFHLFAISGAHIAIISFLFFSVFKFFRISTRFSYLFLMVFLVFYALLIEGRPSVLRATIMTLAFLFGKLAWKDVNLINTVSVSAFILLLINPAHLFTLGFQLTFAATISIILFFPRVNKYLPKLPLRISEIFALSITAQLGVLPFIAYSFNRVAFSSLLLNYAALPLVGLIMFCGYLFLPLSFLSFSLSQYLVKTINFFIHVLIKSSHFFDQVYFLSYRIPTPHLLTMIGYFLFLLLILLPSKIKGQKFVLSFCFFIFFAILISYPFPSHSKNLEMTFIDVGQGESILIEFPGQKKMLVDGGGLFEDTFDIGERVVSPFLWRKGIKKIDYLVLTHPHPDHLNGLKSVARNFRIGEFWEAFSPTENENYREFTSSLPSSIAHKRVFRDHSISIGDLKIEVLHPRKGEPFIPSVHNDHSVVLRVTHGQTSFLITGDIGSNAEGEILKSFDEIKSQVLKSAHHGSDSSSSMSFLEEVMPQIVIISVGEKNKFGFPDQEILDRYEKIGAEVYRTDLHGAVEITSDGRTLSVRKAVGEIH